MDEAQIVQKIQELKEIKPRKEWVVSTKSQILGEARQPIWRVFIPQPEFRLQPALVIPFIILLLIGGSLLGLLKNSDHPVISLNPNFSVQNPEFYLNLAEAKLDEVKKIAQEDQDEKILQTIQETSVIIKKAAESLPVESKNAAETEKIVKKVASINKKMREVQETLGTKVGEEEVKTLTEKTAQLLENSIENTTAKLVESLITATERSSLTEAQRELFEEAKIDYQEGRYQEALEKLLELSNNE
jgi:hypothetical protein